MKSSMLKIIVSFFVMNFFLMNCTIAPVVAEEETTYEMTDEDMNSGMDEYQDDEQYSDEDMYQEDESGTEDTYEEQ